MRGKQSHNFVLELGARLALVAVLLASSCPFWVSGPPSFAQATSSAKSLASSALSGEAPTTVGAPPIPEYRIGVHDVLHVYVWKEPELTATVPVRTDGNISVPLVNDIQADGLTPMQLAANLREKLKTYVEDPRVTVVVSQMHSERIYAVGEVLRAGPMALLPNMTVMQALATAGLNQFAQSKKIYILRTVNNEQQRLRVNYKAMIKGQGMSQNIKLEPGDTIVVP